MRKIIQIAVTRETQEMYGDIFALCDDGSLWVRNGSSQSEWARITDVPQQDDADENKTKWVSAFGEST